MSLQDTLDQVKAETARLAPAQANAAPEADDETVVEGPLYVARRNFYPAAVKGTFRNIKWIILTLTLGIYYLTPFIRWDRGPNAPDQAVLIDFPARRFYFFFIEIWPQEIYYLTGLLILASMALFLMNAMAGRVWCGYLCPQTVWTDLFYAVERWVEGDRRQRMLADQNRLAPKVFARKALKHFLWLMIAWWTGGAWVLYFADAPTLVRDLATFQAPFVAYLWIGILTATTYVFAGHMREQVCTYMCPWPRIQAALTDEYALNVTYRYDRGEPRMSAKKAEAARAKGQPAGDCIDCGQCVAVCPTGVDIREGLQLPCIQCGLCIDACDRVMEKIGRPTRLIAYDTDMNVHARIAGKPEAPRRLFRPRTLLYVGVMVLVSAIMVGALATRTTTAVNVLHDRNPLFVRNSDGSIRNGYTVHLHNKRALDRRFVLTIEGLPGARMEAVGVSEAHASDRLNITVAPDQTRDVRVLVTMADNLPKAASIPITFRVVAEDGEVATARDYFKGP
jgi:cytochrome c oxidase accessory protein FixG